ncbi:MAG: hypothetical protein ACREVE_05770 [Gammaproteobacteria bacterium]
MHFKINWLLVLRWCYPPPGWRIVGFEEIHRLKRAPYCTSYEGDRAFRTDGKRYKHPIDEAQDAEARLLQLASPAFDEFLVLRFEALNEPPFTFSWTNERATLLDYGAILARASQQYEVRA